VVEVHGGYRIASFGNDPGVEELLRVATSLNAKQRPESY
jgi:hypothetical protein